MAPAQFFDALGELDTLPVGIYQLRKPGLHNGQQAGGEAAAQGLVGIVTYDLEALGGSRNAGYYAQVGEAGKANGEAHVAERSAATPVIAQLIHLSFSMFEPPVWHSCLKY